MYLDFSAAMMYNTIITSKSKGDIFMNEQSIKIEYSSRRPAGIAWRAESDGHITYAKTKELALTLHRQKLELFGQMNDIFKKCSNLSVR